MKASPMVPSEAVLSGQAGQTSGDLPAFSHWLPDLGQIPAAEWRVFLRAVSPPD